MDNGLSVAQWQATLIQAIGMFPGGARQALELARATYKPLIDEEPDDEVGKLVRLNAFLASVGDPPPMLIEQLCPDGAIVALSGKPKFGKSLVLLDILESVWRGWAVFGRFRVNRPGPVVYLGMEDGAFEIANRWRRRGTQRDDADIYICADRLPLGTPAGVERLLERIAEMPQPPVLIGVDTAREALGIADWNDTGEVSDKLRPLREMVARKVCSVILVAHNRKGDARDQVDALSGSNAFSSSVDGFISATSKEVLPDEGIRLKMHIEGRHGMRGEATIEMDPVTLCWRCPDAGEQGEERLTAPQRQALAALEELGGECTGPQLAKAISRTRQWANDVLKQLVAAGMAQDTGRRDTTSSGRPSPIYRLSLEALREGGLKESTPIEKTSLLSFGDTPLEPPVAAGEAAADTVKGSIQASTDEGDGWEVVA